MPKQVQQRSSNPLPSAVVPPALWKALTWFFGILYVALAKGLWVIAIIVVVGVIVDGLTRHSTVIRPISVPKKFAEDGLTAEVASQRIRDAVRAYIDPQMKDPNRTRMKDPDLALQGDLPNIVVPTVGISIDAAVSALRTLLRSTRSRTVSGELRMSSGPVFLDLRLDGRPIFSESGSTAEELFEKAAPKILREIRPYLLALKWARDKPEDALQKIDGLIDELTPDDDNISWLHNLKASLLLGRSIPDKADKEAERALEKNANLSVALVNRGKSFHDRSMHYEAARYYREAIIVDPDFALPHSNLGAVLRRQGFYEGALRQFQRAIEIDPKHYLARQNLASLYVYLGLDAEEEYRKAIKLNPDSAAAHAGLARLLKKKNNNDTQHHFEKAEELYKAAINKNPTSSLPHWNLGNFFLDQNKQADAIREFQIATKLNPDDYQAYASLGRTLSSIPDLSKAIAIQPSYHFAHAWRANIHCENEEYETALQGYKRAIEIEPRYAAAWSGLARCFWQLENTAAARHAFRKAIKIDPRNAWLRTKFGELLSEMGETEGAISQFQEALTIDRDYEPARAALAKADVKTDFDVTSVPARF
jgi:tetratricopeptide (TPR) repeat protein